MDLGLDGRTVIVAGASGGVGREIAAGFGAEGAHVVVTYREARDDAERVAKEVGDRALVVPYDQGDPRSADVLVAAALEWTGRVDVLVNSAVAWGPELSGSTAFEDVPDDQWLSELRGNLEGAVRLSRAAASAMRARRWGRMVHLSSSLATDGLAGAEYYAATKSALHGFSRSAAFSLGAEGDILSNVVMLGLTRTDRNVPTVAAVGDLYAARSPLGRLLDAREVATAVVFLASAANTGVTGQVVAVTGGA